MRLESWVRTIGVSSGAIPRMPWETLIFGDGTVPGTPETVNVPAPLLEKARNVRAACLKCLGEDADELSLAEMQRLVRRGNNQLKDLDRLWVSLEHVFLMQYAEPLLKEKIEDTVLGFPRR